MKQPPALLLFYPVHAVFYPKLIYYKASGTTHQAARYSGYYIPVDYKCLLKRLLMNYPIQPGIYVVMDNLIVIMIFIFSNPYFWQMMKKSFTT